MYLEKMKLIDRQMGNSVWIFSKHNVLKNVKIRKDKNYRI